MLGKKGEDDRAGVDWTTETEPTEHRASPPPVPRPSAPHGRLLPRPNKALTYGGSHQKGDAIYIAHRRTLAGRNGIASPKHATD